MLQKPAINAPKCKIVLPRCESAAKYSKCCGWNHGKTGELQLFRAQRQEQHCTLGARCRVVVVFVFFSPWRVWRSEETKQIGRHKSLFVSICYCKWHSEIMKEIWAKWRPLIVEPCLTMLKENLHTMYCIVHYLRFIKCFSQIINRNSDSMCKLWTLKLIYIFIFSYIFNLSWKSNCLLSRLLIFSTML